MDGSDTASILWPDGCCKSLKHFMYSIGIPAVNEGESVLAVVDKSGLLVELAGGRGECK